jgi:cyclopropane-fatty-acyl-phospholipid synthase
MLSSIALAERSLVPDLFVRKGVQRLLRQRLREPFPLDLHALGRAPIALATDRANSQHYEVPAGFFELVLGPHLKYSSCIWSRGAADLAQAEEDMLALTCERAQLAGGQDILELGCGWGSLTLYMAARYPRSRVVAVSNSRSQRDHILRRARERGLGNVTVVTADMNDFEPQGVFDRVVSVEMFEHMRNWAALLERVRRWLRADGKVFLHFFAHKTWTYAFEADGEDNWMGRHFFTGGMMPSANLLRELATPFDVRNDWIVDGTDYAKTAEAWLENLDRNESAALAALARAGEPARLLQRWRMFFIACAELFGFADGKEWFVRHALLEAKRAS